jgi:hypothetical protein
MNVTRRKVICGIAVPITAFSLSGCITRPETLPDDVPLPVGSGFIVLELTSTVNNGQLSIIDYTGTMGYAEVVSENFVGPKLALKVREPYKFWVLALPAGDYSWSRFSIGARFAVIRQVTRFRVIAGAINYVGSLDISVTGDSFSMRALDRESAVTRLLVDRYPELARRHPIMKQITTFASQQ